LAVLALPARAQIPHGQAAVATRLSGATQTQLIFGDVQTGATQAVGHFPSDSLPPFEVVVDPIDHDLIVALDNAGTSRLVRLSLSGTTVANERFIADVPGRATGMTVAHPGDIYLTVGGADGGVYRVPRNGGPATLLTALPRATALFKRHDTISPVFFIAQSGSAG